MRILSSLEELIQITIVGFLNKTNFVSVLQGNSDVDSAYPYGVSAGTSFTQGAATDYNITTSTVSTTVTSLSETGTSTTTFNDATIYTQSD